MSQYFRKFIKKGHFPLPYPEIKFKTFFTNCILESFLSRQYKQTDEDDWNVYWCEKEFIPETLDKIRLFPDKRINHFRNYYEICRKDLLSKNVKRYKKALEREGKAEEAACYDYLPLTYNLPSEYPIFLQEFKRCKDKQKITWIMKPIARSQGKGIFLFKNMSQISDWSDATNQPESYIVQRYISNPLLIGHKKFDMRIYVLVTSHSPLTIYLYRSGFGRFTHYRYDPSDIYNTEMHLTNVAIQKQSDNYDEERGGKYLLDKLRLYILSKYGDAETEKSFFEIQELIIKTLIATSKCILNDKRCFELYGFDIMFDANIKPWLLQINASPSMTANTPMDRNLKNGLLDDTLTIVDIQKILLGEEQQIGGFDLIYKNKRIKNGMRNISFLGCLNNRIQQMRKIAKAIALRLADRAKQEKVKELNKKEEKNKNANDNKHTRGKSTAPTQTSKAIQTIGNNNGKGILVKQINSSANNASISASNNAANQAIKLPKVGVGSSEVSKISLKIIADGSARNEDGDEGDEGASNSRQQKRK